MRQSAWERDGRIAFGLTVAGLAAGLACFVALWRMAVYGSGQTLAEVEGDRVLLLAALPAAVALAVWAGLYAACKLGSRAGHYAATAAACLLLLASVLSMFSIGIFLLPAAALLCCAAALTPRGARA